MTALGAQRGDAGHPRPPWRSARAPGHSRRNSQGRRRGRAARRRARRNARPTAAALRPRPPRPAPRRCRPTGPAAPAWTHLTRTVAWPAAHASATPPSGGSNTRRARGIGGTLVPGPLPSSGRRQAARQTLALPAFGRPRSPWRVAALLRPSEVREAAVACFTLRGRGPHGDQRLPALRRTWFRILGLAGLGPSDLALATSGAAGDAAGLGLDLG